MSREIRYSSTFKQNRDAAVSLETKDGQTFVAMARHLVRDRFPSGQEHIVQRLAVSMVIRQNRLFYREHRFKGQAIQLTHLSEGPKAAPWSEGPARMSTPLDLKGDLEQFVCLYETCDLAEESILFERKSEWIKHMNSHRTRWHCPACQPQDKQYTERWQMEKHMTESHKSTFRTHLVLAMLVNSSAVTPSKSFEPCPLCGTTEELQANMEKHVADHLKTLALTTFWQFNRMTDDYDLKTTGSDASVKD